uniref:SwmB domain-containing protein n=1 Tax=Verminephrobacter aporrectodeae TaxID=1110389 RepID=UPI000237778A
NDAVSFSDRAVTNNTPSGTADTTAPQLLTTGEHRPTLSGPIALVIRFSDASNLDASHAPASGDFTVLADGSRITVTGVDVVNGQTGKYILLELATPVVAGQSVTIAYQDSTPTDASAILDTAGNR